MSRGKINKYECLIGEEILPSSQKQIIEPAKFTHSPLGKALKNKQKRLKIKEKNKQVKAIKKNGKQLIKSNEDVGKNNTSNKKQADKILNELSYERMDEINDLSRKINFNNLTYYFKSKDSSPINFIGFKVLLYLYRNTLNGNAKLMKGEKDQKQFKSNLNEITIGSPKNKSKNQLITIKNINNLYNPREKNIEFYNNYAKIRSEAKNQAKYGEGLKILTPKQMLQRFLIALAQVKAGNNSENLLNEIR